MINIGITGHRGVIGSEFIKRNNNYNFIPFVGDITKRQKVDDWIKKNTFQILLHFAAVTETQEAENNFYKAKKVNYNGTKNLVDSIIKYKPSKLIYFFYASTSHVYKSSNKKIKENGKKLPITRYGLTKLIAENYILKRKKYTSVKFCIGRVFSFMHYKQKPTSFIQAVHRKIYEQNKKHIFFSGLHQHRDVLGAKDVCEAIGFLCKKKATGIYNIASGKKVKLLKIVKILRGREKIQINTNQGKEKNLIANIEKIKKLGWRPKQNVYQVLNEYLKKKGR